jgi:hypothetical protein
MANIARDETGNSFQSGVVVARSATTLIGSAPFHSGAA